MKKLLSILLIGCTAFALSGILTPAVAKQKFHPQVTISSQTGKWKQAINEKPVVRIDCQIIRISGGDDTYINFRFGDDGNTFPSGKRFHLTSDKQTQLKVPVNGMSPNGEPLVINAYNGSVKIVVVTVHYQ